MEADCGSSARLMVDVAFMVDGSPMEQNSTAASTSKDQEQLIRDNLPLVSWGVGEIAARIPRFVPRDDLESAAMFGLYQAARTYDPARGVPFAAFARQRIRGALLDELRSRDWAGRTVRSHVKQVRTAVDELRVSLGREPSQAEIAERAQIDGEELHRANDDSHRASLLFYDSVYLAATESDALAVHDADPHDQVLKAEQHGYLRDAIMALPERLRTVVIGYFFEERPMLEIAEELGVTDSRISQMRAEALELLKDGLNSQLDPTMVTVEENPGGRAARRKAAYYAQVAAGSDYRTRLASDAPSLKERVAAVEASA
ncbi:MAG: polymerase sigma factor for flagellar operon [Actinomycetia bacterium]|nr:polymerase sigma factor for flagellar operon [Actinomycetes bacterium]